MTLSQSARAGFTLIELIIAITIVAILALIVAPKFMGYLDSARITSTQASLKNIKTAIDGFRIQTGRYPTRLRDLIEKPKEEAVARSWQKGGYLEGSELPKDAWTEDFVYKRTPDGKNPYELYSYGPDGASAPKESWISVWKE